MRIVILGGYGVFGSRLARLLLREKHEVLVAGRDAGRAFAFVREHGGQPLVVDLRKVLSPIAKAAPDLVVDAAGPFQAYEAKAYRVARFCIDNGINYVDLSDDVRIPAMTTTHSDARRPPVPIDDDQCGAGAEEHRWMYLLISVFAFQVNPALTAFDSPAFAFDIAA